MLEREIRATTVSGAAANVTAGRMMWRTSSWGVMRSYVNDMMEDLGNQDQLQPFCDYLLHGGATVVSMRPVGQQVNEVIVDNSDGTSHTNPT